MNNPKTIRGYISLIRQIELISPCDLKGFDNLPEVEKEIIDNMSVDISNSINEIDNN